MTTRVLNNWTPRGLSVILVINLGLTTEHWPRRALAEFFHQTNHRNPQNGLLLRLLAPATLETRAELDSQAQVEQAPIDFMAGLQLRRDPKLGIKGDSIPTRLCSY